MEDKSDGKCLHSIRHSDRLSLGISASPASFFWYRILPHSYVLILFRGMFFHLSKQRMMHHFMFFLSSKMSSRVHRTDLSGKHLHVHYRISMPTRKTSSLSDNFSHGTSILIHSGSGISSPTTTNNYIRCQADYFL